MPGSELLSISCIGVIQSPKLETWPLPLNRGISSQHTALEIVFEIWPSSTFLLPVPWTGFASLLLDDCSAS